jgi:hypothetical protein
MFKIHIPLSSDWEQPYSNGPNILDVSPSFNPWYKTDSISETLWKIFVYLNLSIENIQKLISSSCDI